MASVTIPMRVFMVLSCHFESPASLFDECIAGSLNEVIRLQCTYFLPLMGNCVRNWDFCFQIKIPGTPYIEDSFSLGTCRCLRHDTTSTMQQECYPIHNISVRLLQSCDATVGPIVRKCDVIHKTRST